MPAKGQPYLAAGIEIPDAPGIDPVPLDVGLKRGIVIEGRVTDQKSGEPLKAYVEYNAYRGNPHIAKAPGFDRRALGRNTTEADGSYRVVGLPGRGLIAAMYIGGGRRYLTGIGVPELRSTIDRLPVVPNGMLGHFNTLSEIDAAEDAGTCTP